MRVTTAEGSPLPGADLSFIGWRTDYTGVLDAMMKGIMTRERAAALASTIADTAVMRADGVEVNYVNPETVWLVVAAVPGGMPAEGTARIGADQTDATIKLVVRELDMSGRLEVQVRGPDERRVSDFSAHLETLAGTRLATLRSNEPRELFPVPVGTVRLVVRPLPLEGHASASSPVEQFLLPVAKILQVPATGAARVLLRPRLGGRFQLELTAATARVPNLGRGSVTVRRRDSPDAPPRAIDRWIEYGESGPKLTGVWRPGVRSRCAEVLGPGLYVLTIRPDALTSYEAIIHIHPGQTTRVLVAIDD